MASPKVDLEKLNSKNGFNMWKVKIEALLVTQGLEDTIQPKTKRKVKMFLHPRHPNK